MKKRSNKPLSLFVQVISLLLLISLNSYSYTDQTGSGSGVNILQSVGSCSGVSSSGSLSGSEDSSEESSGNFITGEPFDIPAPIAKGSDGIDPTSIEFTAGSGGSLIKGGLKLNATHVLAQTSDSVGTLSFSTIDNVEADVAVIIDGVVVRTVGTTGGEGSTDVSEEELDTPIALAAISEGTPEAIESFAAIIPIVVINSPDEEFTDDFTVTVMISNTDSDTSSTGFAIANEQIAFSSNGKIGFATVDSDGAPGIGYIDISTGEAELLTTEPPNGLEQLMASENFLIGTDPLLGYLYVINSSGVIVADETDNPNVVVDQNICIDPDGDWLAHNIMLDGVMTLEVLDLDAEIGEGTFIASTDITEAEISDMWCAFEDNDTIIVIKEFSSGVNELQRYEILSLLDGSSSTVSPAILIDQSLTGMSDVVIDPDSLKIIYTCGITGGASFDICAYDPNTDSSLLIFNPPSDSRVRSMHFVNGGTDLVFELNVTPGTDLSDNELVLLNMVTLEPTYLGPGLRPIPNPEDDSIIAYLRAFDGIIQVSLMDLPVDL